MEDEGREEDMDQNQDEEDEQNKSMDFEEFR